MEELYLFIPFVELAKFCVYLVDLIASELSTYLY